MATRRLRKKIVRPTSRRSPGRELREIIALWGTLHTGFRRAVRGLPDAALGFRPKPRMRTLGQLVRHTLMAESYYFSRLPGAPRSRLALPRKFKRKREVVTAMRRGRQRSLAILKRLHDHDLDRVVRIPWLPRMSVRQLILYVIAHEVHHRAQLYTYVHLWEPRGRSYARPWWVVRAKARLIQN